METLHEMQRKRIRELEKQNIEIRDLLSKEIQTTCNLGQVLSHLTNSDFTEYLEDEHKLTKDVQNWNAVITEYLENR